MPSPRLREPASAGRRRGTLIASAPAAAPEPSAAHLLLRSWPGRLFLVSAALKLVVAVVRLMGEVPQFVGILSTAATVGLLVSLSYFLWRLFVLMKRRLLWRVRRKLILSYIFIGVVPALLIFGFFLLGAGAIAMNVSAYLFRDGYDDLLADVRLMAQSAAAEIGRDPAAAKEIVDRNQRDGRKRHPRLTVMFLPAAAVSALKPVPEGEDVRRPTRLPRWIRPDGFTGAVAIRRPDAPGEADLLVRAVIPAQGPGGRPGVVIADVPMDAEVLDSLRDTTGVSGSETVSLAVPTDRGGLAVVGIVRGQAATDERFALFSRSVAYLDSYDWKTGTLSRAVISLTYRLSDLFQQLSRAQFLGGGMTIYNFILLFLIIVGVLFLIIQIAALVMGLALARSITSSIHELFTGTERVRQGDFAHRINISTKDQLGELADSFNQMTGSIENLLQTAAEKKRLEEELRIARQIQMSLLPRGPLEIPGLGVTALCVPAREVGGDYYDFFPLGDDRIGVLIADVAGKGTSAALYMAELKGVVMALSQRHQSPREMLIEVNRILTDNLDSRSFITMTYAVLDLARGVMTYCRAGHTPLIFLRGPASAAPGAEVLTPSGMVVGLRIFGAAAKFEELLEEEQMDLNAGDIIVLYTDGITEAMNAESDLFGESRLSRIVEEHGHLDSGELRERIVREIEAFVGGAEQHDDMTMILLKVERSFAGATRDLAVRGAEFPPSPAGFGGPP
jgi:sigma-B regulation protein RsbU (phosphoserine phosphatase)